MEHGQWLRAMSTGSSDYMGHAPFAPAMVAGMLRQNVPSFTRNVSGFRDFIDEAIWQTLLLASQKAQQAVVAHLKTSRMRRSAAVQMWVQKQQDWVTRTFQGRGVGATPEKSGPLRVAGLIPAMAFGSASTLRSPRRLSQEPNRISHDVEAAANGNELVQNQTTRGPQVLVLVFTRVSFWVPVFDPHPRQSTDNSITQSFKRPSRPNPEGRKCCS